MKDLWVGDGWETAENQLLWQQETKMVYNMIVDKLQPMNEELFGLIKNLFLK